MGVHRVPAIGIPTAQTGLKGGVSAVGSPSLEFSSLSAGIAQLPQLWE